MKIIINTPIPRILLLILHSNFVAIEAYTGGLMVERLHYAGSTRVRVPVGARGKRPYGVKSTVLTVFLILW